jgi:hypothetical protein
MPLCQSAAALEWALGAVRRSSMTKRLRQILGVTVTLAFFACAYAYESRTTSAELDYRRREIALTLPNRTSPALDALLAETSKLPFPARPNIATHKPPSEAVAGVALAAWRPIVVRALAMDESAVRLGTDSKPFAAGRLAYALLNEAEARLREGRPRDAEAALVRALLVASEMRRAGADSGAVFAARVVMQADLVLAANHFVPSDAARAELARIPWSSPAELEIAMRARMDGDMLGWAASKRDASEPFFMRGLVRDELALYLIERKERDIGVFGAAYRGGASRSLCESAHPSQSLGLFYCSFLDDLREADAVMARLRKA